MGGVDRALVLDAVHPVSKVQDLRAGKGLILTTGRFTSEAQKEANRDGVPPIELIDGERLVSLFEKYVLGLKPKTVYELVPEFFRSFES